MFQLDIKFILIYFKLQNQMIYSFQENKFYSNISEFQHENYQFYKEGCLINAAKVQELINKKLIKKPIVAKQKQNYEINARKNQQKLQKELQNKLLQDLQVEDRQIFLKNRSVIFEEMQKFKYYNPGDFEKQLPVQRIEELKEIFIKGDDEVKNLCNEDLDYITKNWRFFIKAQAHKRISTPTGKPISLNN